MHAIMSLEEVYRRKYQLLVERCEVLQQDNERLVNRVRQVNKITKRRLKEVKLIIETLDSHGDPFRTSPLFQFCKSRADYPSRILGRQTAKQLLTSSNLGARSRAAQKKVGQRKRLLKPEKDRDPNAPKKPCNAFFQFCQEQRPLIVLDPMQPEPTKQEVTKQLALRWRSLSVEDKKVYVAMFEKSKEKYAQEMSTYVRKEST